MTQTKPKARVLAMVLAGGEGTRLAPLTLERSKPAVPFGGRYRIVDFALSNLVNSGIYSIYLLVQYKSQSLIEHINRSWALSPVLPDQFVTVVPPQMRATAIIRQVLGEVIQPVTKAQIIHEERVDIETIELNFRPVYALEYEWTSKGKRVIVEFDALLGDMRSGGKKWSDQIKGIITRDLFFDVTADAVGMLVPGGSIAVKLVKAVVDRKK